MYVHVYLYTRTLYTDILMSFKADLLLKVD